MTKPEIILFEISIYKNSRIALLKGISYIGSWIGCIGVFARDYDIRLLSGSFLLFSLSLLIEFVLEWKEDMCIKSRIIYILYIFFPAALLLMAFASMLGGYIIDPESHRHLMYLFSYVLLAILVFNMFLSCLLPKKQTRKINKKDELKKNEKALFDEKLNGGNLGNLKAGDKNE